MTHIFITQISAEKMKYKKINFVSPLPVIFKLPHKEKAFAQEKKNAFS